MSARLSRARRPKKGPGFVAITGAVLRRPKLWRIALRQAAAMRRKRWWLRPPFLPLADRKYLQFRYLTAYGDLMSPALLNTASLKAAPLKAAPLKAAQLEDVITWLEWCQAMKRLKQ